MEIELKDSGAPYEKSEALLAANGPANKLLKQFKDHYNESAKISDWSALPILGAAAVAAGLLLYDAGSGYLKGVALGAGTYSAFRFFFVPDGLSEVYLRGQSAVTCVLGAAEPFRVTAEGLDSAANNLVDEVDKADILILRIDAILANGRYEGGGSVSETSKAVIRANKTNLQSEQQTAGTARSEAEAAKGAYLAGPRTIANALESIQRKVVEKVRDGRSVSFADAVASISSAYTSLKEDEKMTAAANMLAMWDAVSVPDPIQDETDAVRRLLEVTRALVRARQNLERSTPGYVEAQEKVGECPNQV